MQPMLLLDLSTSNNPQINNQKSVFFNTTNETLLFLLLISVSYSLFA